MEISRADIKKFQELYMKHHNLKLSNNLAHVKLSMLVRQMEIVYQPITDKQMNELEIINGVNNGNLVSTN